MGFIYTKPMSVEEVFGKFDINHDGKISSQEVRNAKNMDIFTNFNVKKGMTLETFEKKNKDVYAQYEQHATEAYNKQEEKVQKWLKMEQTAMSDLQDSELRELEQEIDQKLKQIKERADIIRDAWLKYGVSLSEEEEKNLPINQLRKRLELQKLLKEDIQKNAPRYGYDGYGQ